MADDVLDLARDCLDSRVTDRHGELIGRIDGIVLEAPVRGPPRVAAIEMGAVTQARRLHPRIGTWVRGIARRFGRAQRDPERIAFSDLQRAKRDWRAEVDAVDVPTRAWERFLAARVIGRIWGAGS